MFVLFILPLVFGHKIGFLFGNVLVLAAASLGFFICTLNVADVLTDCQRIGNMAQTVCVPLFNYIDSRLAFHSSELTIQQEFRNS